MPQSSLAGISAISCSNGNARITRAHHELSASPRPKAHKRPVAFNGGRQLFSRMVGLFLQWPGRITRIIRCEHPHMARIKRTSTKASTFLASGKHDSAKSAVVAFNANVRAATRPCVSSASTQCKFQPAAQTQGVAFRAGKATARSRKNTSFFCCNARFREIHALQLAVAKSIAQAPQAETALHPFIGPHDGKPLNPKNLHSARHILRWASGPRVRVRARHPSNTSLVMAANVLSLYTYHITPLCGAAYKSPPHIVWMRQQQPVRPEKFTGRTGCLSAVPSLPLCPHSSPRVSPLKRYPFNAGNTAPTAHSGVQSRLAGVLFSRGGLRGLPVSPLFVPGTGALLFPFGLCFCNSLSW